MKKKFAVVFSSLLAITLLASCGDKKVPDPKPVPQPTQYNVFGVFSHCFGDKMPSVIDKGYSESFTIKPETHYSLPDDIEVDGCDYEYNQKTGDVTLYNATGTVSVVAGANLIRHTLTFNLSNCKSTEELPTSLDDDKSLTFNVTADEGFDLPNTISVTGCEYTYNNNSVTLYNPTGPITVDITAIGKKYGLTCEFENCIVTGTPPEEIVYGTPVIIPVVAEEGYDLPEQFHPINCECVYNEEIKSYVITKPTGEAEIHIEASVAKHKIITTGLHGCKVDPETPLLPVEHGKSATFKILTKHGYTMPTNVTATNCHCDFDQATGEVILTNVIGDVEVTAVAVAIKYPVIYDFKYCAVREGYDVPEEISCDDPAAEFIIDADKPEVDPDMYALPYRVEITGCEDYEYIPHQVPEAGPFKWAEVRINKPYDNVVIKVVGELYHIPLHIEHANYEFLEEPTYIIESHYETWIHLVADGPNKTINLNDDCVLPETIEVTGVSEGGYEYNFVNKREAHIHIINRNITGEEVNIVANAIDAECEVTAVDGGENLEFTNMDGGELVGTKLTLGQPFSFKMNSKTEGYHVPDVLDITLGGGDEPLSREFYDIVMSDDSKSAVVTIHAEKVINNIAIAGEAVQDQYYAYSIKMFGLETDTPTEGQCNIDSPFAIDFTPTNPYSLPSTENILVNIDGTETAVTTNPHDDCYIVNDGAKVTLTVKGNVVSKNLEITLRAPDYQILNKLSWEQISEISNFGDPKKYFYLGDTKKVQLAHQDSNKDGTDVISEGELYQTVRIVGFNHDDSIAGKAGITFEFADVLSDENGDALTYLHNYRSANTCYQTSLINTYSLNQIARTMLPSDLTNVILPVYKKTRIPTVSEGKIDWQNWEDSTITSQLFLISYSEATPYIQEPAKPEGTCYGYYNPLYYSTPSYIKKDLKGVTQNYWSRSAYEPMPIAFYYCNISEYASQDGYVERPMPIAPLFCV